MAVIGEGPIYVSRNGDWVGQPSGPPPVVPLGTVTLAYAAGASAGFTIDCAITIDWGDGNPAEDVAAGVLATHTYATAGTAAIDPQAGQTLRSFVLADTAVQPTSIIFAAPDLVTAGFAAAAPLKTLTSVEFADPVVLDTCYYLFDSQTRLVKVSGGLATTDYDFTRMFYGCISLTSVPALDTSSGTIFRQMFHGCTSLTTVPALDTSSGYSFGYMFNGCSLLTSVPALDTSSGFDFPNMFDGCRSLTTVPLLNTSLGINFLAMFKGCTSLTTVPALDTSSGTTFEWMFDGCIALTSVPALDTSLGVLFGDMFNACLALTSILAHGFRYSVTLSFTQLDAAALNTFFTNLGTAFNAVQTVTIIGTPGAATCDQNLATAKGWLVAG